MRPHWGILIYAMLAATPPRPTLPAPAPDRRPQPCLAAGAIACDAAGSGASRAALLIERALRERAGLGPGSFSVEAAAPDLVIVALPPDDAVRSRASIVLDAAGCQIEAYDDGRGERP